MAEAKELAALRRENDGLRSELASVRAALGARPGLIRRAVARLSSAGALRDGLGLIGIALISYGSALVYWPAGFIVAGGFFAALAVLMGRAS